MTHSCHVCLCLITNDTRFSGLPLHVLWSSMSLQSIYGDHNHLSACVQIACMEEYANLD
jgi:hypothetical protein